MRPTLSDRCIRQENVMTRSQIQRAVSLVTMGAAVACFSGAALSDPAAWKFEWPRTDFSSSEVEFSEIMSGGPPKDGIPAISDPSFIPVSEEQTLAGREPVITLEFEGETPRAYPVRYLLWHEIVNDKIGATPVAVTYCPLCNSGIVFDRRLDNGSTLSFGVSGKLRHSDMIMFDRETESWWQQAVGRGIVGGHAGTELKALPAWTESWLQFTERNPDGLVMQQPNYRRMYGSNPYQQYDTSSRPFLYFGDDPPHGISPLARVVRVGEMAWPLTRLREAGFLTEQGLEFSWVEGQASPLDTRAVADGREIGTIRVRNADTSKDVAHDVMFAFAFHAFFPEGVWMLGS